MELRIASQVEELETLATETLQLNETLKAVRKKHQGKKQRVRQKYLTICQHRYEWNCWRGEFVFEWPSSETQSISVAMESWSVNIGLSLWRHISKTKILSF
jgi:hypothetical protein